MSGGRTIRVPVFLQQNASCIPCWLLFNVTHSLPCRSQFAAEFKDAQGFGWASTVHGHDWEHLVTSKAKEINRLNSVYGKILDNNKVRSGVARVPVAAVYSYMCCQSIYGRYKLSTSSLSVPSQ